MELKTCAFTGHRPQDLGGFDEKNELNIWIKRSMLKCITTLIKRYNTTEWISGGALGVDQWGAELILLLKHTMDYDLNLTIMKPFRSQHVKWNEKAQDRFLLICDKADEIIECQPDPYSPWKMQYRNKEMCKKADIILAVWNGNDGGTGNCIKYAKHKKLPILRINPIDRSIFWEDKINEIS